MSHEVRDRDDDRAKGSKHEERAECKRVIEERKGDRGNDTADRVTRVDHREGGAV